MPSTQEIDRPEAALDIAQQYLRRERPLSALVALLVMSAFLWTFLATSLLPALAVGAVSILLVRAPVIQVHGEVCLRTDQEVEAVLKSFTGPTPPILVFQWGIADDIVVQDGSVIYQVSYLFNLRSVEMGVQTQTETIGDGTYRVELDVTANGQPWSTYTVHIHRNTDRTVIEYEYTANRRLGLRRVPQRIIAGRYRDQALRKQGYTVVNREDQYSF